MPSFYDFRLQPATCALLANMGITEPTPVQVKAIPALLAGNDVVGQSATGSGKTLAYSIPLVERIARDTRAVQALVLVPTRELAIQVNAVLAKLATSRRLSMALLVGGRPYGNQLSALRYGAQIVVGTPGRVKDHLERGSLVLSQLRMCVLDEADQMLDSGFAPAIEEILATTPDTRQMALFSATMPDWIATLEQKFLKRSVKVDITPAIDMQSTIEQIAYQVPQEQKLAALCTLLHAAEGESSLIFGKTKFGVEKLGKHLSNLGFAVGTLHGNKSQNAREEVLTAFRRGHVQTLLATNVAARGLDIQGIYQVINYELPESSELFTHRIGRTGRMGREGKAITLLVPADVPKWRRMARNLGQIVALQRLIIDEEVRFTPPLANLEASRTREYEQNGKQRLPERPYSSKTRGDRNDEQRLPERPYSSKTRDDRNDEQRLPERPYSSKTRDGKNDEQRLPERPYSGKARDSRRDAGKQSRFQRTTEKHEAHTFAATTPQHRTTRKKPRATSVTRVRRASASNRSASRQDFSNAARRGDRA